MQSHFSIKTTTRFAAAEKVIFILFEIVTFCIVQVMSCYSNSIISTRIFRGRVLRQNFCLLEWEALQLKIQTLSGFSIPNMILAISSMSLYHIKFSYEYRLEPVCTISWSISCDYLSIIQYTARWVLGENLCSQINSCNDHMTIYFNK